jgi:hypothetical protein
LMVSGVNTLREALIIGNPYKKPLLKGYSL